jgi:hypothetical protein
MTPDQLPPPPVYWFALGFGSAFVVSLFVCLLLANLWFKPPYDELPDPAPSKVPVRTTIVLVDACGYETDRRPVHIHSN